MIYHITTEEDWNNAIKLNYYECDSLLKEGFIHTSLFEQVKGVYERYYLNSENLVVLCIEETILNSKLIFEKSTNQEMYPHIYGRINIDAVVEIKNLEYFF